MPNGIQYKHQIILETVEQALQLTMERVTVDLEEVTQP
jgi:hypothetical protein